MTLVKGLAVITFAALFSIQCYANTPDIDRSNLKKDWQIVKAADTPYSVSTWVRQVEGAAVKQFRGEVVIERPIEEVLMLIDDAENLNQWVFFCRDSERVGPTEVYMEYNGKWPVKARYVSLSNKAWLDNDHVFIQSQGTDNVGPQPKKLVKVQSFDNLFRITPLSQQQTLVRFTTFVDIGGVIPKWIANYLSRWAPFTTLNGMKKILLNPDSNYRGADPHNLSAIADNYRDQIQFLMSRIKNELPATHSLADLNNFTLLGY